MIAATTNTAAAANTGRQRAPSHSSSGNRTVTDAIVAQGPDITAKAKWLVAASTTSTSVPSKISRHDGTSRAAAASSINSGATVMMPSASDTNQSDQTASAGAAEGPNSLIATAAGTAAVALATAADANRPNTLRRLKRGPKRSINHAANRASPVLHRAKLRAVQMLLSPMRRAATEVTITATATGARAQRPSATSVPTATPAAGQKTAMRSGSVRRARPSRAARK